MREIARGRRRLPFTLSCRDEDGARYPSFGGDRCGRDGGRSMLANLRIERAYNATAAGTSTIYSYSTDTGQASPPRTVPRPAELTTSDDQLFIDAEVQTAADGTISAIALKRHIPYPF